MGCSGGFQLTGNFEQGWVEKQVKGCLTSRNGGSWCNYGSARDLREECRPSRRKQMMGGRDKGVGLTKARADIG